MKYSINEVIQYVKEDDVKFIRLSFCDIFGKQKNISIMPDELDRAFCYGIAFDASSIKGFTDEAKSDLFLKPDSNTLKPLPWRPEHGKVVRMFCDITSPSKEIFECDTRNILKKAIRDAENEGLSFFFGAEQEFYLFNLDNEGNATKIPYDNASYMDLAPDDKGENIRREICLTLEQMGIHPESSHHEEGPGQNEIDFKYSDPLTTADNTMTFQTVVKTIAHRNGLFADFSPKPLPNAPGNGFHINISVKSKDGVDYSQHLIAGLLERISEMTVFLNPHNDSYKRFGVDRAPKYITWSDENRSQLIRVPAAEGEYQRIELRSADPTTNVYLAFSLIIYASIYGIKNRIPLPARSDINLFKINETESLEFEQLPSDLDEAIKIAKNSKFIKDHLPNAIIDNYLNK